MLFNEASAIHGVVLSGGGAYAAYEVGVMKALFAGSCSSTRFQPLDPAVFTGTSAGAFNAAVLLSLVTDTMTPAIAGLERVWLDRIAQQRGSTTNGLYHNRLGLQDWLTVPGILGHPASSARTAVQDVAHLTGDFCDHLSGWLGRRSDSLVQGALSFVDLSALLSFEPFRRVIRATLRPDIIRRSRRAIRIATTKWDTGELCLFGNADIDDATGATIVLASAAIPGLFPPVKIADSIHVDGGVLMNTPLQPAIAAGADVLHTIYLDPDVKLMDASRLNNIFGALDRVMLLGRADIIDRDIALATRVNVGIDFLARVESQAHEAATSPAAEALRSRRGQSLRQIEIHRYHPSEDLGGSIGVLNVERDHLAQLIQKGVTDTERHDCVKAGCITAATNWGATSEAQHQ